MSRRLVAFGFFALLSGPLSAAEVRFEINDAHVKGRAVGGVRILVAPAPGADALVTAVSDDAGVATVELEPGTWWVSYVRSGYVPIGDSETVIRGDGQVVTTTLSMLLEAEGGTARRRIRIVLNWGSDRRQVRDADAHAWCVCGRPGDHVFFAAMRHQALGHTVELDVDDRDWGGPETVTISDPEPGAYRYWVHQYSRDDGTLGGSDVVVRVFLDDAMAGELRIPPELAQRTWKPFREVRVDPDLGAELVAFTPEEIAAGAELEPPPARLSEEAGPSAGDRVLVGCVVAAVLAFGGLWLGALALRRRRR